MSASSSLSLRARARRRPALLLGLVLAAVAALVPFVAHGAGQAPAAAAAYKRGAQDDADFVPGQLLVRFTEAAASQDDVRAGAGRDAGRAVLLDSPDGQISARVVRFGGSDIVPGLRLAYVAPDQTLAAVAAFGAREDVLFAEPNYVRHIVATPNDPQFGSLYGLQKISAPAAWDITTGSNGVVVGVVDQGIQVKHPDLAANVWQNPGETGTDAQGRDKATNGVDDDGDGYVDDVNGWDFVHNDNTVFDSASSDFHATHVAGTIGAVGGNSTGVVGVNWHVSMMSLKVLDGNGGAGSGTTASLVSAYAYALNMRQRGVNLRALNNSYGGSENSQAELLAIRALSDAGILFVAAAGNDSRDNFSFAAFPANYDSPNVIAVASTDGGDNLSGFSNFSSRLVSVGAPGSGILSTYPSSTYNTLSGTSMATPHVTGAAALVCAAKPDITMQQLRGVLAFTGDVIPSLQGATTTGRRVNVYNAVQRALLNDTTPPAAASDLHVVSQSGRGVTLQWTAPGDDGGAGQAADYDFFFVNSSTGLRVLMPTTLLPAPAGTQQTLTVNVPYLNFSGAVEMRTYDGTGNFSTSSVPVTVADNSGSDPFAVAEPGSQSLSTGGTRLALDGDDKYYPAPVSGAGGVYTFPGYTLPFAFPFYGQPRTKVTISTNGVIYFSTPPTRTNGDADDVPSTAASVQGQALVAGLWDDLMIDTTVRPDSGVYVTQDATRAIFRWQGVTFDTHAPVNFEVELRGDGTVVTRYGSNPQVYPVVAVSGGEPSAYVVASHSNECVPSNGACANAASSLSGASAVTFTPRSLAAQAPAVQFSAANFNTSEDDTENTPRATITVTRTGDTSGASAVTYSTVDDTRAIRCDDTTTAPGVAFARCDYVTVVGTLAFAPGETQKTFTVPVVDDTFVEPKETFGVRLSNPSGATLGAQSSATVSIADNDIAGEPNALSSTDFFVRQQYLDFLSREPEAGQPWSAVLNNCPPGDTSCDRVSVSANFFRSQEFQLKGFFVFRFYKVSFGRLPTYAEIVADMAAVTGNSTPDLIARKAAWTAAFAQRPDFLSAYGSMTSQQFVDALMGRYNLQSITAPDPSNPDGQTKVTLTRADLAAALNQQSLTRAQVVRAISDSDQVGAAEFNSAFVAMQYFGYLRRDPEPDGYNNWLATINANPNDFRSMVNGFVNSTEYRLRFGQP